MTGSVNAGVFDTYLQMSATSTGASGMQSATAEDCNVVPTSTAAPELESDKSVKNVKAGTIIGAVAGVLAICGLGYYFHSKSSKEVGSAADTEGYKSVNCGKIEMSRTVGASIPI